MELQTTTEKKPQPRARVRTNPLEETGPVIWALDPYKADREKNAHLLAAIKLVRGRARTEIEPVSVVTTPGLPRLHEPETDARFAAFVEAGLSKIVRRHGFKNGPTIVKSPGVLTRAAVRALLERAEAVNSPLIAVRNESRGGWGHLGSFTENLLAQARRPVLAISPKTRVSKKLAVILFPTDFTSFSEKAFDRTVSLAFQHHARLVLFHQVEAPRPVFIGEAPSFADDSLLQMYSRIEKDQLEKGEAWVSRARKLGVDAEFAVSRAVGPSGPRILATASRKKADLIVMTTSQGRVGQLLVGSITREVLTNARQPVLVHHSP